MTTHKFVALLALTLSVACGGAADVATGANPSRNVTQGGPQDIAEFRAVLARGEVPKVELLDQVGFFAEHAIDLPAADCGDSICVHPMLAVLPRFDGGNWTMAFIGLNTALDPATVPHANRHLLLVLERSQRTVATFPTIISFITALVPALTSEDRLSVIITGAENARLAENIAPGELGNVVLPQVETTNSSSQGKVDLYAALADAFDLSRQAEFDGLSQRVLLVTSGITDTGIFEVEHFAALGAELASNGVAISTFGVGTEYRSDIPEVLADVGSGNYYFAKSSTDLVDTLAVEGATAFVPLARNAVLTVQANAGYHVGNVYGARRAAIVDETATLTTPVLYMGARQGSNDTMHGRRGGGGGWFVQLVAEVEPGYGDTQSADSFSLSVSYEDPLDGALVERRQTLATPLGVGQNPLPTAPFFSHPNFAKPFMMLNFYLALNSAVSLFEAGDCGRAQGVESMMRRSYEYWAQVYDDPDIDSDFVLLQKLTGVIAMRCTAPVAEPVEVPMGCALW